MIALFKLILVFAGIVFLLSRKWDLGLVLLLASVAVGMLFAHSLPEIGRDILFTIVDLPTLRQALQANGIADGLAALHNSDMLALRLTLRLPKPLTRVATLTTAMPATVRLPKVMTPATAKAPRMTAKAKPDMQ